MSVVLAQSGFYRFDILRSEQKNIEDDEARALDTAAVISLFSDRRAAADDPYLPKGADRRGWWGDAYADVDGDQIGSLLWLLWLDGRDRLQRAKAYAEQALAWMLDDGVASTVTATATKFGPEGDDIALTVVIERPGRLGRWLRTWRLTSAI